MTLFFSLFRLVPELIGAVFLRCHFLLFFFVVSGAYADAPRFGLWVEVEGKNQPFKSKESLERALAFFDEGKFTDLFCQVYREGRTWYASEYADDAPYRESLSAGFDPLREILNHAKQRGVRVHAWVNLLRVGRNAPILKKLGAKAALVDNLGNSLVDYEEATRPQGALGKSFQIDTPGVWLDPSLPEVRDYLKNTIREVAALYPELEGVHLDMARFPFGIPSRSRKGVPNQLELGYSPESIGYFYRNREFTADNAALRLPDEAEWSDWRRSQVSGLVTEIREMLKVYAPKMQFSAAVLASHERAYAHAFQDWHSWISQGKLDLIVSMNYNRDNSAAALLSKEAVTAAGKKPVMIGLGAWLLIDTPDQFARQVRDAINAGADGVVLFSYSNLLSNDGVRLVSKARAALKNDRE